MAEVDWATVSSLATAGGTLVLAIATFASVRSAQKASRVAERALLAQLRPVLAPSRLGDPEQKVNFADGKWVRVPGGGGVAEIADEALYLAMSIRNVGTGIAVLHGWHFFPDVRYAESRSPDPPPLDGFRRLTRDLYVPAGDVGFWQGAFREPAAAEFAAARDRIAARQPFTVDLLYGDHEGGQRVVTRFTVSPRGEDSWLATVGRYWNVDQPDPR